MFSRFDTVPKRFRRMDRRTE